jgi:hypothetical protein
VINLLFLLPSWADLIAETNQEDLMKKFLAFTILLFSFPLFADAILDVTFQPFNSAWIQSVGTPCPEVCKRVNARGEFEEFLIPGGQGRLNFDCKAKHQYGPPPVLTHVSTNVGPSKGWLYGTNFTQRPDLKRLCFLPQHDGKVKKVRQFWCLCNRKVFRPTIRANR